MFFALYYCYSNLAKMSRFSSTLVIIKLFLLCQISAQVTFRNVRFHEDHFEQKFIREGERIKDFIDRNSSVLQFYGQSLPVLYERSFGDLEEVSRLDIADNSIRIIKPGAFSGSRQLETINLQQNQLEEIQSGVFNLPNLEELTLSNNLISIIENDALDHMPSLRNLYLSNNKITTWNSNWFKHTPSLRVIDFRDNLLTYLPSKGFEGMLEYFERDSSEPVESFIADRKDLLILDFQRNGIRNVAGDFLDGMYVDMLFLNGNNLDCFEENKFKILLGNMRYVYLTGNPLDCDCVDKLQELASRTGKEDKDVEFDDEGKCDKE